MKLINPSVEIIEQPSGMEGLFKHIEFCGRTCYKSQDRITEDSAKRFVEGLIKSGHGSVLEHGTVYLKETSDLLLYNILRRYESNKFSKFKWSFDKDNNTETAYITTNYRVLLEMDWLDDLKYMCEPTEHHEKRITVRFNCDIGVSREANRHRVNSVSEQSTRYCNYSKDKFDNAITYTIPTDCPSLIEGNKQEYSPFEITEAEVELISAYQDAQNHYMRLIELGWKPQQARRVLPLGTATELIHTAFISDWKHFLSLRSPKYGAIGVHPDMAYLADNLYEQIKHLL